MRRTTLRRVSLCRTVALVLALCVTANAASAQGSGAPQKKKIDSATAPAKTDSAAVRDVAAKQNTALVARADSRATSVAAATRRDLFLFGGFAVFAAIAVQFAWSLASTMRRGGSVSVESNWGGFGGGLGGWRLSPALILFVASLFFAGIAVTLLLQLTRPSSAPTTDLETKKGN